MVKVQDQPQQVLGHFPKDKKAKAEYPDKEGSAVCLFFVHNFLPEVVKCSNLPIETVGDQK